MTAALLAAVVIVLGAAAAGALRHRLADERSSVRDYQHTLDTLRHLSDRRAQAEAKAAARSGAKAAATAPADDVEAPPSRVSHEAPTSTTPVPSSPQPSEVDDSRSHEEPPARRPRRRPPPQRRPQRQRTTTLLASSTQPRTGRSAVPAFRAGPPPVSMRAEAPAEEPAVQASPPPPPAPAPSAPSSTSPPPSTPSSDRVTAAQTVRGLVAARNLHGPRPNARSMPAATRAERRPWLLTAAAVIVIGVITGVAVAEAPSHTSPSAHRAAATATTVVSHRTKPHASAARAPGKVSKTGGKAPKAPARRAPAGLVAINSSSTAATYQVSDAPFTVTVSTTSGPCWLEATDASNGQLLWEGTLAPGQSQTVSSPAGLLLRLGNSPVTTVTEGGQVVNLPAGAAVVFDLDFQVA